MAKPSGASSWTAIIVGVMFVVAGAWVAFLIGKPILDKARSSAAWPKAAGRIVSSQVAEDTDRGKKRYWAAIEYSFARDGKEQTGKTVSFGASRSSNRASHEAIVERYPVGKQVDVYYHPDQLDVSVLEPGVTASSYFVLIIGITLLGVGVLLTIFPLISRRRS